MLDLTKTVHLQEYGSAEEGRIIVNDEYVSFLQKIGVHSFADLYDLAGGEVIKEQADRSVLRFELCDRVFFLKRHSSEPCQKGGVLAGTSCNWCSEGGKEFAFCHDFRLAGLATVIPIAMGEKRLADGTVASFFVTEDFKPYVQLEELIRYTPEVLAGEVNRGKRQYILTAVACYARAMHRAGFNHQDFNATHVLLHGFDEGVPRMALFDLQRVDQRPWQKFRWPIKALAEFNYSSRENDVFTESDRLFLFQVYCDKVGGNLSLVEMFKYQWLCAKTRRIARHTAKRHARNRKQRDSG